MGALRRATRSEIEELVRDPEWWPDVLARIADGDSLAELAAERVWSWGALWAWIQADEERLAGYDAALKARAQMLAFEALAISDEQGCVEKDGKVFDPDVPRDKLRIDTRLKLASKFDRVRFGENTKVEHGGVIGMSLMTVLASLPRAAHEVDVTPVAVPEEI